MGRLPILLQTNAQKGDIYFLNLDPYKDILLFRI